MSGHDSDRLDPPRPRARRSPGEMLSEVIGPISTGRFIAVGIAAFGVTLAGFWLLRSPPAPVEATLGTLSEDTTITLPPALTVAASPLVVHIAGAVESPGVRRLGAGSRVVDAIEAAGGALSGADPDALNLAAELVDGQRVHVPLIGEPIETTSGDEAASAQPIDINTADTSLLESLPGIGPATAMSIVEDRTRHGPFANIEDLDRVVGIGPATLDRIRDLVKS